MENKYDVIIIGSGMGALTSASILSQLANKKVLVLEQHFKAGGFTHIFKRKGNYVWDVGTHYVGNMQKGVQSRALMDYITGGAVKWQEMPEVYDYFNFPDLKFGFRKGSYNLKIDLVKEFPGETKAIIKYFRDISKALRWFMKYNVLMTMVGSNSLFDSIKYLGSEFALQKTEEYLNKTFKSEKLKALLAGQYGDHGLPPHMSTFVMHAVIQNHYFNGGYFPVGSSKSIADSVIDVLVKNGGKILVRHKAEHIIIKDGKAVGVKVTESQGKEKIQHEFFADKIISNAGADVTYNQLIPEEYCSDIRKEIKSIPRWVSNLTLYIGLKDNPAKLGFKGENHWVYVDTDHKKMFEARNKIVDGQVNGAYLSFPSMKNEKAPGHTAEIIVFCDYEPFKEWEDKPWKNRGEDYEALKNKITEAMLNFVEERYPGFKDIVDYTELATPLTTKHFMNFEHGSIYGIPATEERYKYKWIGYRTPIKNLYMNGADTASHGIAGAMMSGVMSSAIIMGLPFSLPKIMKTARKFSMGLD